MAKKAFTKGTKVTLIGSWDGKGTFFVQDAIVYSCGAKQMVLACERTGKELGRHFAPSVGTGTINPMIFGETQTFPRMERAAALALAKDMGAQYAASEKARMEGLMARFSSDRGYVSSLRSSINSLILSGASHVL